MVVTKYNTGNPQLCTFIASPPTEYTSVLLLTSYHNMKAHLLPHILLPLEVYLTINPE